MGHSRYGLSGHISKLDDLIISGLFEIHDIVIHQTLHSINCSYCLLDNLLSLPKNSVMLDKDVELAFRVSFSSLLALVAQAHFCQS